jgi:hypothetical protein
MKNLIATIIALISLPTVAAASSACDFTEEADKTLRTEWAKITHRGFERAKVSAMTTGGEKLLGLQFGVSDYYLIPDFHPNDPQREEKVVSWVQTIKRDSLEVPAGSTLRITFSDMTSLELKSVGDVTSQGYSERPRSSNNETSNYRINAFATVTYALPPDDFEILTSKIPISMRLEAKARYYSLGDWNETAGQVVLDTMKCLQ